MNRSKHFSAVLQVDHSAPDSSCGRGSIEQTSDCGRSQCDDEPWLNDRPLDEVPVNTRGDLLGIRPPMQTSFASNRKLEMLNCVCDEELIAIQADFEERRIEHTSRRSDKRLSGDILVIAGLFAKQH